MRFSIVVPNRNSGPLLRRALDSLLEQSGVDLEIVVADCASTDESSQTIDEFAPRLGVILREADGGLYDGLNRGFARASGDIFGWLGADDELLPAALAEVARIFSDTPGINMVTGACEHVYPDGSRRLIDPHPDPWQWIDRKDVIEQPATFWRAALHREVAPIDGSYHTAGDWDLWCRMRRAGARIATTADPLARYYFCADNLTARLGNRFTLDAARIFRTYARSGSFYAWLYQRMYLTFDLAGAMDSPPSCGRVRQLACGVSWLALRKLLGEQVVEGYNWHFASLQERGLPWWGVPARPASEGAGE